MQQESRVKDTRYFSYPLVLDLYPYTEEASMQADIDAMPSVTESNQAEDAGKKEHGNAATNTADKGKDKNAKTQNGKKETPEEKEEKKKRQEAKKLANERKRQQALLDLSGVNPKSSHLYNLFAVVIHSGKDAGYGHYHAYLRDQFHLQRMKAKKEKSQSNEEGANEHQEPIASVEEATTADGPMRQPHLIDIESLKNGWYDFNDSTVKPIPVEKLTTQYAGRGECACTPSRIPLAGDCLYKSSPRHVDLPTTRPG